VLLFTVLHRWWTNTKDAEGKCRLHTSDDCYLLSANRHYIDSTSWPLDRQNRDRSVVGLGRSDGRDGQAPPLTAREGLTLLNMVSTPGWPGRRTVKFDDNAVRVTLQTLDGIRLLAVWLTSTGLQGVLSFNVIAAVSLLPGKCFVLLSSVTGRRCCLADNAH